MCAIRHLIDTAARIIRIGDSKERPADFDFVDTMIPPSPCHHEWALALIVSWGRASGMRCRQGISCNSSDPSDVVAGLQVHRFRLLRCILDTLFERRKDRMGCA
jgi:hypothetical protein